MNRIALNDVHFGYPGGEAVLNGLTLDFLEEEIILLLGQNGAGKSTLLKLLNGILKPQSGKVIVNGHDTAMIPTAELARDISITFQNPGDQLFASTVREEVSFAPKNLRRSNIAELVEKSLNLFALTPYAHNHPYDLHLAQRKLITLASAFAADTPFLAFDEPSASLSQVERSLIHAVIAASLSERKTLLIISHDLECFLPLATRLLILHEGRISFDGTPDEILQRQHLLRHTGIRIPLTLRLNKILEDSL
ncbi:MAG: ABC transporter ATP-binding protein [bacterium]